MTSWQDIVLMVGGFGFSIALIQSVVKKVKMPTSTPLLTVMILISYIVVYASYGLWLGVLSQSIVAVLWLYLLRVAIRKEKNGS